MVIFAEQKFTEIPVPRICVENATTVPKMKIIMQCNNILMFLQKKWFSVHFLLYFRNRNFRGADFQNFCSGTLKIGSQDGSRCFFSKNHENFEKTHSSQILRSWNKVFVKSPILKCECLNYLFKYITSRSPSYQGISMSFPPPF